MNQAAAFRPEMVKIVAYNVGYLITVLLAACGYRRFCGYRRNCENPQFADAEEGGSDPSGDRDYRLYGAKTSYDEVREKSVEEVKIPGCIPKRFWLLSRHGARYPGPWELNALITQLPILRKDILKNAQLKRGCMKEEDLFPLRDWRMEFSNKLDNQLTPGGEREMKELAQRFKLRFPSLLGREFNSEAYEFRHTDSHRTADSARHFASGLFGVGEVVDIPKPLKDDPVIKFYKTCKKWREEVDDNEEARGERARFRLGPEMKKVVENVSSRLGFIKPLPFEDVYLMFTMCRFESATHPGGKSPWCAMFRRDEVEVMEYDEDLDYYWTDGYGYPINYEQACPPVKDFLDHFRSAMQNESDLPVGVFRFSHSGLMLKVYARMGLFRDSTPPKADNFLEQSRRQWRSSLIDPFTANLALVLFECGDEGHKVLAYVQEREVVLPGCPDFLCPMDAILNTYGPLADSCNVALICDGHLDNYAYCRQRKHAKKRAQFVKTAAEHAAAAISSSSSPAAVTDREVADDVATPVDEPLEPAPPSPLSTPVTVPTAIEAPVVASTARLC